MTPVNDFEISSIITPQPGVEGFLLDLCRNPIIPNRCVVPASQINEISKFRSVGERQKRILARSFLYEFVERRYGVDDFTLATNAFQKPYLLQFPQLNFSFSYSQRFALVGISEKRRIGVDFQYMDPRLVSIEMAYEVLSTPELCEFERLSDLFVERKHFFYRAFSLKEAIVKAYGTGLSYPINTLNTLDTKHLFYNGICYKAISYEHVIDNFACAICYETVV